MPCATDSTRARACVHQAHRSVVVHQPHSVVRQLVVLDAHLVCVAVGLGTVAAVRRTVVVRMGARGSTVTITTTIMIMRMVQSVAVISARVVWAGHLDRA